MKRPENAMFMNFVRTNEVHLYNTSTRTHLLVLQDDHREGQCKAASYSIQDHVLINHVIKAGPAELIEHCISRCIEHPGCHSSNFYRISKWCELNDKTHASHPEDMRQVPFTNYMENTLRPLTCNKDSECGKNLICFLSKCVGEFGYYLIIL